MIYLWLKFFRFFPVIILKTSILKSFFFLGPHTLLDESITTPTHLPNLNTNE